MAQSETVAHTPPVYNTGKGPGQFDFDSFDMQTLLRSIPSVHSMKDIPFVNTSESMESGSPYPPPRNQSPFQAVESNSLGHISLRSYCKASTESEASFNLASGPETQSNFDKEPQETSTPPALQCVSLNDIRSLHKVQKQLCDQIKVIGPVTINSLILASVYHRYVASFNELISVLYAKPLVSIDPHMFSSLFSTLRNMHHHLQRIGSTGIVFENASCLSSLIKWDYRQLVNSFLTLLKTSPGFLATAYRELTPTQQIQFLGKSIESAEDVYAAQRQSPLGILFYAVLGDEAQRINYFAALCAELLTVTHDSLVLGAVCEKFTMGFCTLNEVPVKKLNKFLRALTASSQESLTADVILESTGSGDQHAGSPSSDFYLQACKNLISILNDSTLLPSSFIRFVATLKSLAPHAVDIIHTVVRQHYLSFVKSLLSTPHRYGVLSDVFIGESNVKTTLASFISHFSDFLGSADDDTGFLSKLYGDSVVLEDIDTYYLPSQFMVLSLGDIIFLLQSLLPAQSATHSQYGQYNHQNHQNQQILPDSIRTASERTFEEEENEWCLDNIRSDMQPVIKELSQQLPHYKHRMVKQYPGLFSEYWQLFRIEADGLVNDMDSDSWVPPSSSWDPVLPTLDATQEQVREMLALAKSEAQLRGDYVSEFYLETALALPEKEAASSLISIFERSIETMTSHNNELQQILDLSSMKLTLLKEDLAFAQSRLTDMRFDLWYTFEVRNSTIYSKAAEVVNLLKGETSLQRSNSGSHPNTFSRRFSTRKRRLSILSTASQLDSFFVSKDYLIKPKLADREVELTLKYLKTAHVHNLCKGDELLHRFNAEIYTLINRLLDREFLINGSNMYQRDVRQTDPQPSSHRMSMSVLTDLRNRPSRSSSANLADIFDVGEYSDSKNGPPRSTLAGYLLSDLGHNYLSRGSEVDEFMQQTGRMLLDGDDLYLQGILQDISHQSSPEAKLQGFTRVIELTTAKLSLTFEGRPARADIVQELVKKLGREPGTLFRDLQLVSGILPSSFLDNCEAGQCFWDVAEAAMTMLDTVINKSMYLAVRMMEYHKETQASTEAISNQGIADIASIWSFAARQGRPVAQRKLAQLYLECPQILLEIFPFSRPAHVFDSIDPCNVRVAVAAHWLQLAMQQGDKEAKKLYSSFI